MDKKPEKKVVDDYESIFDKKKKPRKRAEWDVVGANDEKKDNKDKTKGTC